MGVEVLRRLRQAGRRLAVAELARRRDEHGNRVASLAAYRALLRAVHMLARRGLVEEGFRRLGRERKPRLVVWLPGTGEIGRDRRILEQRKILRERGELARRDPLAPRKGGSCG